MSIPPPPCLQWPGFVSTVPSLGGFRGQCRHSKPTAHSLVMNKDQASTLTPEVCRPGEGLVPRHSQRSSRSFWNEGQST